MPLAGKTLLVCGADQAAARAAAARAAAAAKDPTAPQLRALLALKSALDRTNTLTSWTPARGVNGGFCSTFAGVGFPGIKCDAGKNVIDINLYQMNLSGTLPPAEVLVGLPRLIALDFSETGIRGMLPANWSQLVQLEDIRMSGNELLTGGAASGISVPVLMLLRHYHL